MTIKQTMMGVQFNGLLFYDRIQHLICKPRNDWVLFTQFSIPSIAWLPSFFRKVQRYTTSVPSTTLDDITPITTTCNILLIETLLVNIEDEAMRESSKLGGAIGVTQQRMRATSSHVFSHDTIFINLMSLQLVDPCHWLILSLMS